MRYVLHALAFAILATGALTLAGHAQEPKKPEKQKFDPKTVRELMFKKLENAQKLLAALCLNDLETVGKCANELNALSKQAEWKLYKTPQYEMNSNDFQRGTEALAKHAKDKNVEGAKLAYLELTLTCFHCHRYVRDVGMIRVDRDLER